MLDVLPTFQSMKRAHRIRKFRPSNAEHTEGRWRPPHGFRARHNPTTYEESRAA